MGTKILSDGFDMVKLCGFGDLDDFDGGEMDLAGEFWEHMRTHR